MCRYADMWELEGEILDVMLDVLLGDADDADAADADAADADDVADDRDTDGDADAASAASASRARRPRRYRRPYLAVADAALVDDGGQNAFHMARPRRSYIALYYSTLHYIT